MVHASFVVSVEDFFLNTSFVTTLNKAFNALLFKLAALILVPCVYKRHQDKVVMFLVLYVDDILLIGNDVGVMSSINVWLSSQFNMKDLGEANFILGIKLW